MLERLKITKLIILNYANNCLCKSQVFSKSQDPEKHAVISRTIESKAKVVYVKRGHILKMATLRIFSGYKRKKSIVWEHVHVSSFLKHLRYKSNYGTETTELFKFLKVRVTFF